MAGFYYTQSLQRNNYERNQKTLQVRGAEMAAVIRMGSAIIHTAKENKTVHFLSDFRELNKRLIRKPFPLPKISTVLQELEGFATALDLNMGYYTIRLDPDASKICTIIFPWGKYSYQRLPMGIAGSPDIFN